MDSERIAELLVQEGMQVQTGQVLARLETRRLRDSIAIAEAQTASAQAALDRLKNGTRPEKIEQGKATVASERAELAFADTQNKRNLSLSAGSSLSISKWELDETQLRLNVVHAKLTQEQKGLRLAEIRPAQRRNSTGC